MAADPGFSPLMGIFHKLCTGICRGALSGRYPFRRNSWGDDRLYNKYYFATSKIIRRMEAWELLILFVSAFAGVMSVFLFKKENTQMLKLILSFCVANLFALTVLLLMLDVYLSGDP